MIRRLFGSRFGGRPDLPSPPHDCHCHILPGVDDGAETVEESLSMARALVSIGFTVVHCTPHSMPGHVETPPGVVREGVKALQKALDANGIPLLLRPGMEYYLDEGLDELLKDPVPLGDTRMLLIEVGSQAMPEFVTEKFFRLSTKGFTVLIAHPERCWTLSKEKGLLESLMRMGCKLQLNLGSLSGQYGSSVRKTAESWLKAGYYDFAGSDGHASWLIEKYCSKGLAGIGSIKSK